MMRQGLKGRALGVREQVRPILGLVITSFTLAPLALARQVVVQSESPLRGGPNRTFRSIGVVTVGYNDELLLELGRSRRHFQWKRMDLGRTVSGLRISRMGRTPP